MLTLCNCNIITIGVVSLDQAIRFGLDPRQLRLKKLTGSKCSLLKKLTGSKHSQKSYKSGSTQPNFSRSQLDRFGGAKIDLCFGPTHLDHELKSTCLDLQLEETRLDLRFEPTLLDRRPWPACLDLLLESTCLDIHFGPIYFNLRPNVVLRRPTCLDIQLELACLIL